MPSTEWYTSRRAVVWTKGQVTNDRPKTTGGVRDVTIPPHLMPMVTDHLANHVKGGQESLVFHDRDRDRLIADRLSQVAMAGVGASAKASLPRTRGSGGTRSGMSLEQPSLLDA